MRAALILSLTLIPALLPGLATSSFAGEELIVSAVTREGKTIPYILNTAGNAPRYVVILFPGGNGVVNPRIEDGNLAYEKRGNFLLRSRKFLVDNDFAAATTNSTQVEQDVQALLDDLHARFPAAEIYLMGTSRGTYDTMALAGYLADKVAGEIHTSSLSQIAFFEARKYPNRHLVVHHKLDACRATPYASAARSHDAYGNDFIAMDGGVSEGDPCEAHAYHGFQGIEKETIAAIKQWIRQPR